MLDIKKIRDNLSKVTKDINLRNQDYKEILTNIFNQDEKLRELKTANQSLEAQRNKLSKDIGVLIQTKNNEEAKKAQESVKDLKLQIEEKKKLIAELEEKITQQLLAIPNIPHKSVPKGKDESHNQEIRKWGTITKKTNKAHWEIAEDFNLVDFARAVKLSGTRFVLYRDQGAILIRALFNFMLDQHRKSGYIEHLPPLIVNKDILVGTGQLPKFADDQFKIDQREQYLIPTAEVPLTNIYRDEIIKLDDLPLKMCAYTPCFRLEAGSAGKDTRGLIRMHQFNKVELVHIVKPEDSYEALEELVKNAESILQLLEIPYRTIVLCTGDMGFSATKTYDIELWLPAQQTYREVSSCSNCEDFQTRRMNLRASLKNTEYKIIPHTLNGSGLAVDRVFAAILENYYDQEKDEIIVPKALHPYMNGIKVIKKNKN